MQAAIDISGELQRFEGGAARVANIALGGGVIASAVAVAFGVLDGWDVFFRSYLLNYSFVLTLALGALFFVMLQHLTRAGWSVSVRRLAEFVAATLPVLAVLFIPLIVPAMLGLKGVWLWTNSEAVANDPLLQSKQPYLNVPFFFFRLILYFGVWVLLARYFFRTSVAQDASGDPALSAQMGRWSAPGMLLFALTLTFFSFDTLMSLNPHWFSTIFGVYIFSGCVVGFFALLAVLVCAVQASGRLQRSITVEHYHDIGKLAFGFVVFWAYIAFSQYMLIWYANLPEETVWYRPRQGDTWWAGVSLLLLFGHFVAPFLAMISRWPKRRRHPLLVAAVWLLFMHWLDLYYIVIPRPLGHGAALAPLHVSDVALLAGLGGIFVWAMTRPMAQVSLIPARDPRLPESLTFQNI